MISRILYYHEMYCGIIWSAISGVLLYHYYNEVVYFIHINDLKTDKIYDVSFSVNSVLCGFISAFYGIIATNSDKFLTRIQKTNSFKRYILYIQVSIFWALLITAISAFMLIVDPDLLNGGAFYKAAFVVFGGCLAGGFASYYRVIRNFFVLV